MQQATECRTVKFSCLVFVRVEKQRFGDANFSGGEIILIGQLFAVGSLGVFLGGYFRNMFYRPYKINSLLPFISSVFRCTC